MGHDHRRTVQRQRAQAGGGGQAIDAHRLQAIAVGIGKGEVRQPKGIVAILVCGDRERAGGGRGVGRRIAGRDGRLGAGGRGVQGDPGRKAPAGRAQGHGEGLVALGIAIVRRRHADGLHQVSPARVGGEGQRGISGRGGEIVRHRRVA